MQQGKVAYHSIMVEVLGNSVFTPIDFQFPAHHKVCTGLMIESSLMNPDVVGERGLSTDEVFISRFSEGQGVGELAIEFQGSTVNFHHVLRYTDADTRCLGFHELHVVLLPNIFTKGHFTNEALITTIDNEVKSEVLCRHILTLTFRTTT